MNSQEKFYSIIVTGKSAKVQAGFLDEDGKPKGTPVDVTISKAGTAVPNYSIAWGKQNRDKKTNLLLDGSIEFLSWGHQDGSQIELRWLPTSESLDLEWQRDVKKLKQPRDEYAEINFDMGINNYDRKTNKALIMMLEHHYLNGSNASRPPHMPSAFNTYDPEKINEAIVMDVERRQVAENIVLAARFDATRLETLASLFNMDPRQQQHILFANLMERTMKYENFMEVLALHRKEYENLLMKAIEVGLIDTEPVNAMYLVVDGRKDELFKEIEPGKLDKKSFVLLNFYDPKFFSAFDTLRLAYKKFEAVLQ